MLFRSRVVTAMVTPFDASGAVDLSVAANLARHLVDQGSDGLLVCGTTGESPTLSWDEQLQLLQAVRDAVGSDANALELWLCGDQIRKGAALNAVQIAELLIEK